MSVLKIPKNTSPVDGVIKAKESAPFRIYKKNFVEGDIHIPLTFPPKVFSTRILTFYALDASGPKAPSCGGEESNLSLTSGSYYKGCSASS
jgi:hypothetical protein